MSADLARLLAAAGPDTRSGLAAGVITQPGGEFMVNLGGEDVAPRWQVGYMPQLGDAVVALRVGGVWTVLGATTSTPMSALPNPDPAAPPPRVPPPSPKAPSVESDVSTFTATDSGTWDYAGTRWSDFHGKDLTQGSYGGKAYAGAWFYGGQPKLKLAGFTVAKAEVRIGARRRLGSWGQSVALHLKLHTSASRGGSFVTSGTHDVTLGPTPQGAQWVTLPASWGQTLITDGGGLGIAGDPYAGVVGVGSASKGLDPQSGLLRLTWTRNETQIGD